MTIGLFTVNEDKSGFDLIIKITDDTRKCYYGLKINRFVLTPNLTNNNEKMYTLSANSNFKLRFRTFDDNKVYDVHGEFEKDKNLWCKILFQQPSPRMLKTKESIFNLIKDNEEYIKFDLMKLIYDNIDKEETEESISNFLTNSEKELTGKSPYGRLKLKMLEYKDNLSYQETKDLLDDIINYYYEEDNIEKLTFRRGSNINDIILPCYESEDEIGNVIIIMSKFKYDLLGDNLNVNKKFGVSISKQLTDILLNNDWTTVKDNNFKHKNSKKYDQMQLF